MNRPTRRALAVGLLGLLAVGCGPSDPASREKPAVLEPKELQAVGPGHHQLTVTLPSGEALRYTISVPPGYSKDKPAPLIVALHYGYDGSVPPPHTGGDMVQELVEPAFTELNPVIVAPDALGGDWLTAKNEQAVVWLAQSVMKTYAIDPKKVALTGYSLGGEGTWFLAGRHQDVFTAAIPVSGAPAGGSLEWKVPVYVIHSDKDEVISLGPTKAHVEALKAKGANVELKVVSGLTHYQVSKYAGPLRESSGWLKGAWK
jgi:predicted peptidase